MSASHRAPTGRHARTRINAVLLVTLAVAVVTAIVPAIAADDVNLSADKGPGADDVTLSWTAGHGGPYTVFLSPLPPPENLPGNAVGTTAGLTWTESTPIPPGVVLFFRVLGAGCLSDDECPSGFCSDGYCCDAACLGACVACDLSGSEGTCTPILTGQDPDDECVSGEACDGAGACAPCPVEVCNGQDDDCDGVADDGNPGGGESCDTGLPGVCAAGTTQCESGTTVCEQQVSSSPEICDGLDNDCDGAADDGNPEGGSACSTGLPGVCAAGTLTCTGGTLTCVPVTPPSADLPDEGFVDSNCDGIDGDLSKAIFVATDGSGLNSGTTPESPVQTIADGLFLASFLGRNQVLVAIGSYVEALIMLENGVGIYGGYADSAYTTRTSSPTETHIQSTRATAMVGSNLTAPTDIQLLYVRSHEATAAGTSTYGIQVTNSSGLRIRYCRIEALSGASGAPGAGTAGANGGNGGVGQSGCEHSNVIGCETCNRPLGGSGGSSSCGSNGGAGGSTGLGSANGSSGQDGAGSGSGGNGAPGTPSGGGNWITPPAYHGQIGGSGTPGIFGSAGSAGSFSLGGYSPQDGADGTAGLRGRGGGGGGGGGGGTALCDSYGGGGGGGGAGGCGSAGGFGGGSGGGSFAVYLWASNALIENTGILTASGGPGGIGGTSGPPGTGGQGGHGTANAALGNNYGGSSEQDDGSNGGRGGNGGAGGQGGHGGGGAGGPSVGVVIGGGSVPAIIGSAFNLGPGGAGGGSPGIPGPAGASASTLTP